jgi:hypothetical protein
MVSPKSILYRLPFGLRMSIFAAISILLSAVMPYSEGLYGLKDTGERNLGTLYAIIVAFLLSIAIGRRRSLQEMVLLELNKVRRINHLAKNIILQTPELVPWFDELHACLDKYLLFFREHDLGQYEDSNLLFRRVTYLVYSLPQRHQGYNATLYGELLDTTGSATEAREYVCNLITPGVGDFQVGVVLVISLALSVLSVGASPFGWDARIGATAANFCTFLVLEIFFGYEFLSARKRRQMADKYVLTSQHLVEVMPD